MSRGASRGAWIEAVPERSIIRQNLTLPIRKWRLGVRTIVAIEPIAIVETDVAEQRDLEPEADAGAELEVPGLDLLPQIPGVARVQEDHSMQRMDNRKLLLDRIDGHEAAAGVADGLKRPDRCAVRCTSGSRDSVSGTADRERA